MKKRFFICLTVMLMTALLITGCSNAAVDTNYADVVGYVIDGEGNPVVGVTVDLPYAATATEVSTVASARSLVSLKPQKTDEKGMFTFENLPSGKYIVEVYQKQDKKTGVVEYAKVRGTITVSTLNPDSYSDGVYTLQVQNIVLPKLGATLSGTVILNTKDEQAEDIIAASKEIVLSMGGNIYVPTVTGTGTKNDPYAVTYSQYVKATTDANGVVSFANLPIMSYNTSVQKMTVSYFDLTTNQTRSANLDYATDDTNGENNDTTVEFGGLYPLTYTAGKIYLETPTLALNLVSTNTKDQYNNTNILALASDITLTFDRDVASSALVLKKGSEIVDAVVTNAGSVVTVNPAVDLEYNTTYTLTGKVYTSDYATYTANLEFSTIPDPAQPVVPVFAVTASTENAAGTYDSGNTSINVTASSVNTIINNYFIESRYTGEASWNRTATIDNIIDTSSTFDGTTYAFSVTPVDPVVSGKTLELRMVAQTTVAGKTIEVVSDVATVADETAPAFFIGNLVSATPATTAVAGKYVYRVTLSGTQPMTAPVLAFSLTTLSATIVDDSDNQKQTSYLVTITEPAGNAAALGTVTLTLKDAAGNSYDSNAETAGVQDPVRNVYNDGFDW